MNNIEHLNEKALLYSKGEIDYPTLKHAAAKLGIYKQRDDRFMSRIRVPGGEISAELLKNIVKIARESGAEFIHFTTRGCIQLHGIEVLKLVETLEKYMKCQIHFLGAGGNALRGTTASEHSGLINSSEFDVTPYAKAVEKILELSEMPVSLPRKMKIGFSCCRNDCDNVKYQEVGFVAKSIEGKKYFTVYIGGNLGRSHREGIKFFDSIEAEEFFNISFAAVSLFHDHGNREDRNKARMKFIIDKIGEEAFKELFNSYYKKTKSLNIQQPELLPSEMNQVPGFSLSTIYIPYGNIEPHKLLELILISEKYDVNVFRITREQNLLVNIDSSKIKSLKNELAAINPIYNGSSFKGLITTCIGAKTCHIGLTNTSASANITAETLDRYFADKQELKEQVIELIIKNIRISGCSNSCSFNKAAKLGLSGVKTKNENGELLESCRFSTDNTEFTYSESLKNKPLSENELSKLVLEFVSNLIK